MWFGKKTKALSDVEHNQKRLTDFKEFEVVAKELAWIREKLDFIENKTELIQTDFRSLRRKINVEIFRQPEEPKTENLKTSDGLNSLRGL